MTEMTFDVPAFREGSGTLQDKGKTAGQSVGNGVNTELAPPGTSSSFGSQVSMFTGQLQNSLAQAGPSLTNDSSSLDSHAQSGLAVITNQDQSAAAEFSQPGTQPTGEPGSGEGTDSLDADSIDKEARDKAEDMLGGDQTSQMMTQMLQMGAQMGQQIGQQVSQQLNQIGQQLGQAVQQGSQQVGQMVGKAAESLSKQAVQTPDLGGIGSAGDFSGAGDFGGGGGGGGGGGIPGTEPAGLHSPVTPINTSSALQPSPLQAAGGGAGAAGTASRAPGMPMMPMHGMHGAGQGAGGGGKTQKRDPVIFPDKALHEPPSGVNQTLGANPEIDSDEPPFDVDDAQEFAH